MRQGIEKGDHIQVLTQAHVIEKTDIYGKRLLQVLDSRWWSTTFGCKFWSENDGIDAGYDKIGEEGTKVIHQMLEMDIS